MPWLGAPVGGFLVHDVVDEACEFGPQRPLLPEKAIDKDCKADAQESANKAGWNDGTEW